MKRAISLLIIFAAAFFSLQAQAEPLRASRTASDVYINDIDVWLSAYNINDNNYFKLRELAAALSGTSAAFDVRWNEAENRIELTTGIDYSGTDAGNSSNSVRETAYPTDSALVVDGRTVEITAYNINDNNYYKLRDLGEVIPFDVYWSEEKNSVCVYTELGNGMTLTSGSGEMRHMSLNSSTRNWQTPTKSYIFRDGDSLCVVDADTENNVINIDTYDSDYNLTGTRTVNMELPVFGAFYAGENYNYIALGQENPEEDDSKEVIRIIKYDKDFNRLASVSVNDCYTVIPFDAGCPKMCESENGKELVLHTSRERYLTEDGLNHQSQLTVIIDTDSMTVKNSLGQFQPNHVSHSFNQFVLYDGDSHVLLDHGDAYPRGVVLNKYSGGSYSESILLDIPGNTGNNYTGVSVGGFAVSENNYIAAANALGFESLGDSSFPTMPSTDETRDIVILTCERGDINNTSSIRLTDYSNSGLCASLPYLVDLENGYFMVLWQEFNAGVSFSHSKALKYAVIDENGALADKIYSAPLRLSMDCQPILDGDKVVWYTNSVMGRLFSSVNIPLQ